MAIRRKGDPNPDPVREDADLEEDVAYTEEESEDGYDEDWEEEERGLSEDQRETLGILGRFLWPVGACFAVFLLLFLFSPLLTGRQDEKVMEQQQTIKELTDRLDAAKNESRTAESSGTAAPEGVYTGAANEADDKLASDFFSRVATWTNGESYELIRSELSAAGYDDSSSLVQCFVPKDGNDITYDAEGHRIYAVDTEGRNMSFENLTSYQVGVAGEVRSYVGDVTVSSRSTNGMGQTVEAHCYVKYTVTGSTLSEVEAWALWSEN